MCRQDIVFSLILGHSDLRGFASPPLIRGELKGGVGISAKKPLEHYVPSVL